MVMQGLPDAQAPENVLTLIDDLQTRLLKSAEHLGQIETKFAEQTGVCSAEEYSSSFAVDNHCNNKQSIESGNLFVQRENGQYACLQANLSKQTGSTAIKLLLGLRSTLR